MPFGAVFGAGRNRVAQGVAQGVAQFFGACGGPGPKWRKSRKPWPEHVDRKRLMDREIGQ